ncbi:hypothetical protein SSS_01427 [Sarcoptes scabiei]|uniref:MADF domain-containing protein n=1 Tax=Sarcoptes scabiei TaxID=52283 RepID=A0A132AC79_SARSC|nr:hypothetical protein SSS_01427 [Sarcoptes scabiei]KPM08050.1 hypothetical protein QR98_0065630 [Sarcoptes scabiei]UXI21873.1 nucleoside diphosphate-linked moiety X motif 19-like [Sarcoptes scabiei]
MITDDGEEESSIILANNNGRASLERHVFSLNEILSMINLIKRCELIWNKNHPEYNQGLSRAVAFDNIAKNLNIPVEDVRWKWQILRKEYFKKISNSRNSRTDPRSRPWKWSGPLSFLDSVIDVNGKLRNRQTYQTRMNHLKYSNNTDQSKSRICGKNQSDSDEFEMNSNVDTNINLGNNNLDGDQESPSSLCEQDDDETEPKFLCETIYSPSKNELDDDDRHLQQQSIIIDPNREQNHDFLNNHRFIKRKFSDIERNRMLNFKKHHIDCGFNMNRRRMNEEENDSSKSHIYEAILQFLESQNTILLNKSQKEDMILKQLIENDSRMIEMTNRDRQWQEKLQDPFFIYLNAKLSLLQDVPRSAEFIDLFYTAMDEAFKNVYNKFIASKDEKKKETEANTKIPATSNVTESSTPARTKKSRR